MYYLITENAFFDGKYLFSMVGKYPISFFNKFIQQSLLIVVYINNYKI